MSILANGTHTSLKNSDRKLKDLIAQEPYPMEKLNWLIHLFHVRGELKCCQDLIQEELRRSDEKNEFAHFKKAVILKEEGKIQEALEIFQICHKLNSQNIDNFKEIGKCLFLLRRYRLALEAYLEAENVATKPDWEIYHNIGECYLLLKDIQNSKDYIQKAIKLGKQEISYNLLIKILTIEDDIRSAVGICNSAVESCPDSVNMLTKSGIFYLKVGETQHAFERLSSALALDSTNPKALLGIGCITQNHNEHDVALSKFKIAVQMEPNSVAVWNNIGMCFYSKQKYIAAVTCLKRALWLSPLNWRVLLNLGLVNLLTNQPASSFNFLCAAVNIRPDISLSFMLLGCSLLELRDKENAFRALHQAVNLNPNDPFVIANAALCAFLAGQNKVTEDLLEKFKDVHASEELTALCESINSTLRREIPTESQETEGQEKDLSEQLDDEV